MSSPDAPTDVHASGVGPVPVAAAAGTPAHPPRSTPPLARSLHSVRPPRGSSGSLALEAAMVLPLVALCALALFQLVGVTRDAVAVQEAARVAARVAATSDQDGAVHFAAVRVLGAGHLPETKVEVRPSPRRSGDVITVTVTVPSRFGPFRPVLRATAVTRGEPVLGGVP